MAAGVLLDSECLLNLLETFHIKLNCFNTTLQKLLQTPN